MAPPSRKMIYLWHSSHLVEAARSSIG